MREILFRGKRIDNGEWVEGCLLKVTLGGKTAHLVFGDNFVFHCNNVKALNHALVDPATIGQYTGLDTNGKKIFEGDIVRILGDQTNEDWKCVDYNALIAFLDGGFCALDGTIEEHGFRRYALSRMDFSLEVIGNIHDNPDLLEGGADNAAD